MSTNQLGSGAMHLHDNRKDPIEHSMTNNAFSSYWDGTMCMENQDGHL